MINIIRIPFLFSFLLILGCNPSKHLTGNNLSENYNASIKTTLDNYFDLINNQNWDGVVNNIYPAIFEFTPKESFTKMFKELEEGGMQIKMTNHFTLDGNKFEINEDKLYSLLKYTAEMDLHLNDEMVAMADLIIPGLQASYGEENVNFVQAEKLIKIKSINSMFFISEDQGKKWYVLENKLEEEGVLKEMLNKIIPADLYEKLKY